jgi:hypothetical protein
MAAYAAMSSSVSYSVELDFAPAKERPQPLHLVGHPQHAPGIGRHVDNVGGVANVRQCVLVYAVVHRLAKVQRPQFLEHGEKCVRAGAVLRLLWRPLRVRFTEHAVAT